MFAYMRDQVSRKPAGMLELNSHACLGVKCVQASSKLLARLRSCEVDTSVKREMC